MGVSGLPFILLLYYGLQNPWFSLVMLYKALGAQRLRRFVGCGGEIKIQKAVKLKKRRGAKTPFKKEAFSDAFR